MDNCTYDATKILCKLAKISWFIEHYAKQDAEATGHTNCSDLYKEIQQDLEKNIQRLQETF